MIFKSRLAFEKCLKDQAIILDSLLKNNFIYLQMLVSKDRESQNVISGYTPLVEMNQDSFGWSF